MFELLRRWRAPDHRGGVPLVAFLHVPRTGGASMRRYLRETFGDRLLLRPAGLSGARSKQIALAPLAGTIDAVGGHVHYGRFDTAGLERDVIYISVIRDPVRRMLSQYIYQQAGTGHARHEQAKGRTLAALVEETDYLERSANAQLRVLFGSNWRTPHSVLRKERFLVGKLEHLDGFLGDLRSILPAAPERFPLTHRSANAAKQELQAQPGYEAAVARITEALAAEIAFYNSFGEVLMSEPLRDWQRKRRD
jgi:hypothetical protein